MKQQILQYAKSKFNSNDHDLKKFCKIIVKNIDDFYCYYCLDVGKVWCERENVLAAIDFRGKYDIRKCNKCSNNGWIECAHTQENYSHSGIKIFRKDNVTLNDIIDQLKIIYSNKVLEDDPIWHLYKKDVIEKKTTQTDITINVKDLATAVKASLQIYAGNLIELVNEIENITINLSHRLTNDNDKKEIIKTYEKEGKKYYLLFKMEKNIKERSALGSIFKSTKFRFKVNYVLLCPSNKPAQDKCNEIMNDNIDDRINNFKL